MAPNMAILLRFSPGGNVPDTLLRDLCLQERDEKTDTDEQAQHFAGQREKFLRVCGNVVAVSIMGP